MTRSGAIPARFVVVLLAFGVTIPAFYRPEVLARPLEPLVLATAGATSELILLVGLDCDRDGATLSASQTRSEPGGFAYRIAFRCTGFLPALILAVAVLAFPAPLGRKLAGLALGLPLLLVLNLVRLVHLFYLGVHRPEIFDFAHRVAWEAAVMVAVAVAFVAHVAWCRRLEVAP